MSRHVETGIATAHTYSHNTGGGRGVVTFWLLKTGIRDEHMKFTLLQYVDIVFVHVYYPDSQRFCFLRRLSRTADCHRIVQSKISSDYFPNRDKHTQRLPIPGAEIILVHV